MLLSIFKLMLTRYRNCCDLLAERQAAREGKKNCDNRDSTEWHDYITI